MPKKPTPINTNLLPKSSIIKSSIAAMNQENAKLFFFPSSFFPPNHAW